MTNRIDVRHGYVWRWCFAVKGTPQIVSGWGSWDTKAEAEAARRAHVREQARHKLAPIAAGFEVRRVPCNLQPLENWPQKGVKLSGRVTVTETP